MLLSSSPLSVYPRFAEIIAAPGGPDTPLWSSKASRTWCWVPTRVLWASAHLDTLDWGSASLFHTWAGEAEWSGRWPGSCGQEAGTAGEGLWVCLVPPTHHFFRTSSQRLSSGRTCHGAWRAEEEREGAEGGSKPGWPTGDLCGIHSRKEGSSVWTPGLERAPCPSCDIWDSCAT